MTEKRMLILPSDLVQKIDDNRGDVSQEEFINFLITSRLEQKSTDEKYVTKEAIGEFEQEIKDLLRSFLEFFISYGLEFGRQSDNNDMDALTQKLQNLAAPLESESRRKRPKG